MTPDPSPTGIPLTEHYDRSWTTDVAPHCAVCHTEFPCKPYLRSQLTAAEAERDEWKANAERKMARLRIADEVIAATEQALRERTSALERIAKSGHRMVMEDGSSLDDQTGARMIDAPDCAHCIALAALAPQQTGEGE